MSDKDTVYRQAAINAAIKADMKNNNGILSEKRARVFDECISSLPSAQPEQCSDCIANGGDWECDHIHCRKGQLPFTQPEILACGEGELIANTQKPTTRGKRAFTNPIDDYPPSFEVIDAMFPVDPMKSENDNVEYKNGCDDGYERKTGKWVKLFDDTFHCQLCGHTFMVIQGEDSMNYCPNCGAKMEEEDE